MTEGDSDTENAAPRGIHDMGGLPAGPVEAREHEAAFWEKRVDALMMQLFKKRIATVDEMRRGIESLPPEAYDRLGYYERWALSARAILLEKGLLTDEEIEQRIAGLAAKEEAPRR